MSRVIVLNDTLTFSTSTGDQRKQTEGVREEQRKNKWEEDREGKKERARDEGRCLRDTRGKEHNIHIRDVWPLESELKRETAVDVLIYTLAFAHKRRQGARLNDYFDTGSEGMREQMTCTSAKQTHSRERASRADKEIPREHSNLCWVKDASSESRRDNITFPFHLVHTHINSLHLCICAW